MCVKNVNSKLILFFAFILSFTNASTSQKNEAKVEEARLKLKNWAFCKCLDYVYPEDSVLAKDGSLSGYFQTGNHGVDTYDTISSLARVYALKEYMSYDSSKLGIMKCLDFYNSWELDSIIKSLDSEIIFY